MVPTLRAALLCGDAILNEEGDYDLHSVFRRLEIEAFPAEVSFKFFAMWSGLERRDYSMTVDVRGPGVAGFDVDKLDVPVLDEGYYDWAGILPMQLRLNHPGDLHLEIRMDGHLVGTIFVPVSNRVGARRVRGTTRA